MRINIIKQHKLLLAILIISFSTMFTNPIQAQATEADKAELELFQSVFGVEKKGMISDFLKIDSTDPFWATYDEYEIERKELGVKRLKMLEDYVDNYLTLDEAKTDEIVKSSIKEKKALDALIDKYYKKIRKTSGTKVAAQFYHFENYLLSAIRLNIYDNIPAIGALDHK